MSSTLLLYLFIWFSLNNVFRLEQHGFPSRTDSFNVLQTFQTYWVESSTKSSQVIQNSCSIEYPVFYQSERTPGSRRIQRRHKIEQCLKTTNSNNNTTISGDILFVNKIPLFATISHNLKFTTVNCIINRTLKNLVI